MITVLVKISFNQSKLQTCWKQTEIIKSFIIAIWSAATEKQKTCHIIANFSMKYVYSFLGIFTTSKCGITLKNEENCKKKTIVLNYWSMEIRCFWRFVNTLIQHGVWGFGQRLNSVISIYSCLMSDINLLHLGLPC